MQGRTTAHDLLTQNINQIHLQITKQLDEFLKVPSRINHINAHLISQHKLDLSNIREWRHTFFEQLRAFDMLSSITWGDANGQAVWIVRNPDEAEYVFAVKDSQTGEEIYEYQLDPIGNIIGERFGAYKYDPRIRPWYKSAITAGKPTWSRIYAWVSRDGTESTLGPGFGQPIQNNVGKILGVINAEVSLYDISQFLEKLQVGKTGLAFVTNREGQLIATSSSVSVTDMEHNFDNWCTSWGSR